MTFLGPFGSKDKSIFFLSMTFSFRRLTNAETQHGCSDGGEGRIGYNCEGVDTKKG